MNNKIYFHHFVVLFSLLVIVNQGFAYVDWNLAFWNPILKTYGLVLLWVVVFRYLPFSNCNFKYFVLFQSFFPFVTIITSFQIYGQDFLSSIKVLLFHLIWLSYFMFHKMKISEKTIIKVFFTYSFFVLFLQIYQQFTYPNAAFGILSDEGAFMLGKTENIEIRNGLYRFRMGNGYITIVILLYFIEIYKNKMRLNSLVYAFFMLVSIYLTLTRQVIASASIVVLFCLIGGLKNILKIKYISILVVLVIVFITYSDVLFGEFTESVKRDANEDNIRILSYLFYWEKIVDNIPAFFLGNGYPAISGNFQNQMAIWNFDYGFWTGDIGFVGMWFHYGLLYVLMFFYLNYLLVVSYKDIIPNYLRLSVLFTFLMSPMINPYFEKFGYFYWAIILYLCDNYINKQNVSLSVKNNK